MRLAMRLPEKKPGDSGVANDIDPREGSDAEVIDLAQRNAFPVVARPAGKSDALGLVAGIAIVAGLGLVTMWSMNSARIAPSEGIGGGQLFLIDRAKVVVRFELGVQDHLVVQLDPIEQTRVAGLLLRLCRIIGQKRVELCRGLLCRRRFGAFFGDRGAVLADLMGVGGEVLCGAISVGGVGLLPSLRGGIGGQRALQIRKCFDQFGIAFGKMIRDRKEAAGICRRAGHTQAHPHLVPQITRDNDIPGLCMADQHIVKLPHPGERSRRFRIEHPFFQHLAKV